MAALLLAVGYQKTVSGCGSNYIQRITHLATSNMQLKTLETVQQSIKNLLYKAHEKNWKNGGVSIYDLADLQEASDRIITQDRADIRAVLKEGVEKTVCASEAWEGSYDPMEYQNGYARAKKDILTLIDTLLPGEVSN